MRHGSGRPTIFAAVVSLLSLALAAASLMLFLSYRTTTTAQISQMQQALTNAQADNQSNASSYNSLSGRVRRIDTRVNGVGAVVDAYGQVCSQALTNPNVGVFYFPCASRHP